MRLPMVLIAALLLCACASRAEEAAHFRHAAASPLRDMNLVRDPIPDQLATLQNPYGYTDKAGCAAWSAEVVELQRALSENAGRRVGFRRDGSTLEGRTGNIRDVGVKSAVSYFIPFRGLVRQVSGAARHEQKAEEQSAQARYRIGYLVGMGRANDCPGFGPQP